MNITSRLVLVLLTVFSFNIKAVAQALGQHPSKLNWQSLQNPTGNIIYPKGMEWQAQRIANILNFQKDSLTSTIGQKIEDIGLVLHNQTVVPNGFVTLAPFRSEFFSTPPENTNILGSVDWLDILSIHEYRHVQQQSNTKYGASKVAYWLGGEFGWGAASTLSIPNWFYEGDAVWVETNFTNGGRGRIPSFTAQQRALAFADINFNYQKSRNGSFKDNVPNQYPLGYMMLSYLRNEKGPNCLVPVLKDASAYKGIFYPFSNALKRHTGYRSTSLYNAAWSNAKQLWRSKIDSLTYKTSQFLFGNNEYIDRINLTYNMAMSSTDAIKLAKKIEEDLKKRFDVAPNDQGAIRVGSFAEDIKQTMVVLGGIYIVIFLIGIGTLISGVIGIGNIMTFSIKERTKELGIRKALGASPKSIITMVLQESILITSLAGYIGLLIGILVLKLIGNNLEEFFILNPKVDTGVIVMATITLIFFGVFAGYIPAKKAAKIKPIIALRDE